LRYSKRKKSLSNYAKRKLTHSAIDSVSTPRSFKIIPMPTQNIITVMNGLKEIEDENEDDE